MEAKGARRLAFASAVLGTVLTCCTAFGQGSPALDPNWIELHPIETFFGVWANQFTGFHMRTVKPFTKEIPEGVVFISGIDTIGLGPTVERVNPVGARRQNTSFSLFGKPVLELPGIDRPEMVRLSNGSSMMIACQGSLQFFSQNSNRLFDDDHKVHATIESRDQLFGEHFDYKVRDLDNDGKDDLIAVSRHSETQSSISFWRHSDLLFRGDTTPWGWPTVPATQTFYVSASLGPSSICVADFDQDGVYDLVFAAGGRNGQFPDTLFAVQGRIGASGWLPDSIFKVTLGGAIEDVICFDFLWSDRRSDLLFTMNDTILCVAGRNEFFELLSQHSFDLLIPSPSKLDPSRFLGGGRGRMYQFGYRLFNAGQVNGSSDNSLATYAEYQPDTSIGGGVSYFFIYSGGMAANEQIDAIFSDDARYALKTNMDTLRTSGNEPTSLLIADPYNTMGRTGRLDYIKGTVRIPHAIDSRWTSRVAATSSDKHQSFAVVDGALVIPGATTSQALSVYDYLGRVYSLQSSNADPAVYELNLPRGVYIIPGRGRFVW